MIKDRRPWALTACLIGQACTRAPDAGAVPTVHPATATATAKDHPPAAARSGVRGDELVVADFVADSLLRFQLASGAPLGSITQKPELDGALGMALGADGHLYVASEESDKVLRLHGETGAFIGVFVGDAPETPEDETGGLKGPAAVLFGPDGALYVSSFDGDAVLRYDGETGVFIDVFVDANAAGLDGPDAGMTFGPGGDLFVPSYYTDQVLRFDGVTGEAIGPFTPADGSLSKPRTLLFVDDWLLVTSEGSGEVVRFAGATGAYIDTLVPRSTGLIGEASGMALADDRTLLVASITRRSIEAFDLDTGAHLGTRVGSDAGLQTPTHMLVR